MAIGPGELKCESKQCNQESQCRHFPEEGRSHVPSNSSESRSYEDLCQITLPVGSRDLRMMGPRTAEESTSRISFWWGITSAAIALARHVREMGDDFASKQVLELGCGLGLAGIAAALCGANVTFTDYVEEALDFARKNAALNGLETRNSRFRVLDWEQAVDLEPVDYVLGSEILYDYFFHGSLISVMKRIVAFNGVVLLADRKRLCVSRFVGRLVNAGFRSSESVVTIRVEGFPCQEITVFELRRA